MLLPEKNEYSKISILKRNAVSLITWSIFKYLMITFFVIFKEIHLRVTASSKFIHSRFVIKQWHTIVLLLTVLLPCATTKRLPLQPTDNCGRSLARCGVYVYSQSTTQIYSCLEEVQLQCQLVKCSLKSRLSMSRYQHRNSSASYSSVHNFCSYNCRRRKFSFTNTESQFNKYGIYTNIGL